MTRSRIETRSGVGPAHVQCAEPIICWAAVAWHLRHAAVTAYPVANGPARGSPGWVNEEWMVAGTGTQRSAAVSQVVPLPQSPFQAGVAPEVSQEAQPG